MNISNSHDNNFLKIFYFQRKIDILIFLIKMQYIEKFKKQKKIHFISVRSDR